MKKIILIIIGCLGVGLGAVGAILPVMPAFPFLLLAAVCFAKSSERLDRWFRSTKLYKNDLESFVKSHGMICAVWFLFYMGAITDISFGSPAL